MSMDSPIVNEVRQRRLEISAEHDHDLHRYCEHLRSLQKRYEKRLVSQLTVVPASQQGSRQGRSCPGS